MLNSGNIPIDLQRKVLGKIEDCIIVSTDVFGKLPDFQIEFRALGHKCAGTWETFAGTEIIKYDSALLCQYPNQFIEDTVPHEVAHHVAWHTALKAKRIAGSKRIPFHGKEWQRIMIMFGAKPSTYCKFGSKDSDYDVTPKW